MEVREKAYAKINLTLGVTGVKDGYHMLDSVVCTPDMFDLIKLKKRRDKLVCVTMRGLGTELMPPEENNAYKSAVKYVQTFQTSGADIVIYKNIPLGAGLGGSSADVAGTLRGLAKLYGKGSFSQLKEIADSLGSDTGYMLSGGFARLTGRGENVQSLGACKRLYMLLLVPQGGVSTSECFKAYDQSARTYIDCDEAVQALREGDAVRLGKSLKNALYESAITLNPDVKTAFEQLSSFSPLGVSMTGSGSGVFALFETAELTAWAKSRYVGKFACYQLKTK